ncbi:acyl-CoA dehydrogenase family protein [Variibacter gotjawalensis]|nr:acyl-CoA dehydrogenase family protein [Variibacter gotjawalensis]NIK47705.1 alkylation response protein AidB-like acyl-CoA dehydrogenase [Variibacter gotjawalensis]
MAILIETGAQAHFAPPESGGAMFRDALEENTSLFDVLRIVGRSDLSLGRLFEGHINAMKLFGWFGTSVQKHALYDRLQKGALYGVWATEPPPGVEIHRGKSGRILEGRKMFASGAGGLNFAIITARTPEGEVQLISVPGNVGKRADTSRWLVRGMRSTMSGTYDVSGFEPGNQDYLGKPGDYAIEPRFTAGAWRFLAVQLGGIEALLAETRTNMSDNARSDPLQRQKFGEAVASARTAYLWVREAARRAAEESVDAPSVVRMARGVVERSALDVMELSARIVGTRSAFDDQRIDKIIRDLGLYLRQAGPDQARDQAAIAWLDHDAWGDGDLLW